MRLESDIKVLPWSGKNRIVQFVTLMLVSINVKIDFKSITNAMQLKRKKKKKEKHVLLVNCSLWSGFRWLLNQFNNEIDIWRLIVLHFVFSFAHYSKHYASDWPLLQSLHYFRSLNNCYYSSSPFLFQCFPLARPNPITVTESEKQNAVEYKSENENENEGEEE